MRNIYYGFLCQTEDWRDKVATFAALEFVSKQANSPTLGGFQNLSDNKKFRLFCLDAMVVGGVHQWWTYVALCSL